MDTIPPSSMPAAIPVTPEKPRSILPMVTGVILIILLAALGTAGYVYRTNVEKIYTAWTLPHELWQFSFQDPSGHISKWTLVGMASVTSSFGAITAYVPASGVEVALIHPQGQTIATQVVVLSGKSHIIPIIGLALPKTDLDLSPDGTHAAYAEQDPTRPLTPHVKVLTLSSGETQDLGPGTSPHLVSRDGTMYVVFLNEKGIAVKNISKPDTDTSIVPMGDKFSSRPLIVSKDGTHLAYFDTTSSRYLVFTIDTLLPTMRLVPAGTLPPLIQSVRFGAASIYGVVQGKGSPEIWKFPLTDTVGTGKNIYTASRISIQNLI